MKHTIMNNIVIMYLFFLIIPACGTDNATSDDDQIEPSQKSHTETEDSATDTAAKADTLANNDQPTEIDTSQDTDQPTEIDTSIDTDQPTEIDTSQDTDQPTEIDTSQDTDQPTEIDTSQDTDQPTEIDTSQDSTEAYLIYQTPLYPPEMLDCDGGKLDPITNLCWQEPPYRGGEIMAGSYCNDLVLDGHSNWRLPNIDELISLMRGCQDGTPTADLSRSLCVMNPEDCVLEGRCYNSTTTCKSCYDLQGPQGPGAYRCYWDGALSGPCLTYPSSTYFINEIYFWTYLAVNFESGLLTTTDYEFLPRNARCVRDGP